MTVQISAGNSAIAPVRPKLTLIQAGRGLAALLVVLFHVTELSHSKLGVTFLGDRFAFGGAGIDFFFVLSGFIICYVHRGDWGQPAKLRTFLIKRFARIYPLYWLVTLAVLPVYFWSPAFGFGHERQLDVIVKSLLLIPQSHFPIVIVGWTLSHEVFFYLMFSVLIALPWRRSRVIVGLWLAASLGLFGLERLSWVEPGLWLGFILSRHNLEFALGCGAALWVLREPVPRAEGVLLAGLVMFGLAATADHAGSLGVSDVVAYGLPSGLIVLGAASCDRYRPRPVPKFFEQLGDASYSLYLVHYAGLSVLLKGAIALGLPRWGSEPVLLGITAIAVGLGFGVYALIEAPLNTLLRQVLVPSRSQAKEAQR